MGRARTRLRVGVSVRVRVGFMDSIRVQSGQKSLSGTFGARGASAAFSAHGLPRPAPLATNCWPEAPCGGAPPQTKGTIVGKKIKIYNWENLIRPFLIHKILGPEPPLPPTHRSKHDPCVLQRKPIRQRKAAEEKLLQSSRAPLDVLRSAEAKG